MRVVYFDGHCNLCNGFVDFLLRRDRRARYQFASLQGATAKTRLPTHLREQLWTVVLEQDGEFSVQSTAVLETLAGLGGGYRLCLVLLVFPRFLRDTVYRAVARNRYTLFGRRDLCRVPTTEEKNRFLD